jgi:hypothetical protein
MGTVEIPTGGSLNITQGSVCTVIVTPQSLDATLTNASTSITINDTSVAYTVRGIGISCPVSGGAMTFTGTFTLRSATARDNLAVTAAS